MCDAFVEKSDRKQNEGQQDDRQGPGIQVSETQLTHTYNLLRSSAVATADPSTALGISPACSRSPARRDRSRPHHGSICRKATGRSFFSRDGLAAGLNVSPHWATPCDSL